VSLRVWMEGYEGRRVEKRVVSVVDSAGLQSVSVLNGGSWSVSIGPECAGDVGLGIAQSQDDRTNFARTHGLSNRTSG
jgi:hypothetical protein